MNTQMQDGLRDTQTHKFIDAIKLLGGSLILACFVTVTGKVTSIVNSHNQHRELVGQLIDKYGCGGETRKIVLGDGIGVVYIIQGGKDATTGENKQFVFYDPGLRQEIGYGHESIAPIHPDAILLDAIKHGHVEALNERDPFDPLSGIVKKQ